jgi:hypothetical protein
MNPLLYSQTLSLHSAELARDAARHHEVATPVRSKRNRRPLRGLGFLRVPRTA